MNKIIKKIRKKVEILFFLLKYKFLKKHEFKKINLLNYKIVIQNFLSFYYEIMYIFKDEIYFFSSTQKNPLIIDGGVCIGTSLLYFKNIYPNSRIIGFEPSPEAFLIAKQNIKINNLNNVQLYNLGLYKTNGKISFSKNMIDSGKIDEKGDNYINVDKLSNYINEEVDFLKLNIEGSEKEVIEELAKSEKIKLVKEMCFEWHSFSNQDQNLDEILKILKDNNFKYLISSFSNSVFGRFYLDKETQYFLTIYAKRNP